MRWIDLLIAAVFIIMAFIQWNDPDPAYWVLVYGATAVLAIAAAGNRFSRLWTAIVIGAVAVGLLEALPGAMEYLRSSDPASLTGAMLPEKPWVEPAREFFGLFMALAALLWYLRRQRSA